MIHCRSDRVSSSAHGRTPRGASWYSTCRRQLHFAAVISCSRRLVACTSFTAGAGANTLRGTGGGVSCCRIRGSASSASTTSGPGAITCRPSERLRNRGNASAAGALGRAACCATRQQREEVAESQLGNTAAGDQSAADEAAAAAVAAEAAAEAAGQAGLQAPPKSTGSGSNMGTGTKYALMSTLEEQASIDAIEELQVPAPLTHTWLGVFLRRGRSGRQQCIQQHRKSYSS